jgi:hypothetical protein
MHTIDVGNKKLWCAWRTLPVTSSIPGLLISIVMDNSFIQTLTSYTEKVVIL